MENKKVKVLKLVFKANDGKKETLTIAEPKEDLDESTVRKAMDLISKSKAFKDEFGFYKFDVPVSAKYYTTELNDVVSKN